MVLIGVWVSAVGYGVLPPPVANQQWTARFKPMFRVIGPLLVLIGLVLSVAQT
jgi:hypothetical protein